MSMLEDIQNRTIQAKNAQKEAEQEVLRHDIEERERQEKYAEQAAPTFLKNDLLPMIKDAAEAGLNFVHIDVNNHALFQAAAKLLRKEGFKVDWDSYKFRGSDESAEERIYYLKISW